MKKLFLPTGLLVALAAALLWDVPGTLLKESGMVPVFVVIIFLINGWKADLRDLKSGPRILSAIAITALISLAGGPLLAVGAARVLTLPAAFRTGLIVMCAMAPTLSSCIVITDICGGNALLSMTLTISINIAAIVIAPWVLQTALSKGSGVAIAPLPLLIKLTITVLLPFLAGFFSRRISPLSGALRTLMDRPAVSYVPSLCVIITVWALASSSRTEILSVSAAAFLRLGIGALGVHLTLMILQGLGSMLLHLEKRDAAAMVFTGSQKTLPIAASVLLIIAPGAGSAVIACILFHFLQLLVDSVLASALSKQINPS